MKDEVHGKLLSQKQQNDQANKINALIKQIAEANGDKSDVALNATSEKKQEKKNKDERRKDKHHKKDKTYKKHRKGEAHIG